MRRVAAFSILITCMNLALACERGPAPTPPPDPVVADDDGTGDAPSTEPATATDDPESSEAPSSAEPPADATAPDDRVVEPAPEQASTPDPAPDQPAEAEQSKVANANLHVGSATVDGLTVNELECRVEGGGMGLLGNLAVIGALAKRKSAIAKCGKPGTEAEVRWTASGGKITKAEGTGSEGECAAKQLRGLATPANGECAAMIVL